MKKLTLVTFMLLLGSAAVRAQAKQVDDSYCNDLWQYVYSPWRFSNDRRGSNPPRRVCMVFEGTIEEVHPVNRSKDGDGDVTMRLRLDKPFHNIRHLGVEVICAEPVRGHGPAATAARVSCAKFSRDRRTNPYPRHELNKLKGRHVRITGYFVTDYGHVADPNGHPEIHPVARITVLR